MLRQNFNESMLYLQKLFGKKLEPDVMSIFWNALKGMSDEQFKESISNIVQTFIPTSTTPFPVVAHFMAKSTISPKAKAHAAVEAVKLAAENIGAYQTVSFGDRALHSVIERFGGWQTIARWGEEWKYQEKNFMEAYLAAYEYKANGPEKLLGIHAKDNAEKVLTERQKALIAHQYKPRLIEWAGFDSAQLEAPKKKQELNDNRNIDMEQIDAEMVKLSKKMGEIS